MEGYPRILALKRCPEVHNYKFSFSSSNTDCELLELAFNGHRIQDHPLHCWLKILSYELMIWNF